MSALGQTEKNSVRAHAFRFAPRTRTLLDAVGMSQTCHQRICERMGPVAIRMR